MFKDIANLVKASETACKQTFYYWKKFGTFISSPRFGRPKVTDYRIDEQIQRSSEMDRKKTIDTRN